MKIKLTAEIKTILKMSLLLLANFTLTLIVISILADGLLEYKTGFYVLIAPIIFICLLILFYFYFQTKKFIAKKIGDGIYYISVILTFINIVIIILNIMCWIDLFDGRTEVIFP